jgi:hypothetical protein
MFKSPGSDRICKIFLSVATALILPALAYAGTDNGNGNGGQNNGYQNGHNKTPVVPEANAGWVLAPLIGVVLLLSWRQLARAKA